MRQDALDALRDGGRREAALGQLAELALLDGDAAHALVYADQKTEAANGSAALAIGLARASEGQLNSAIDAWIQALTDPDRGVRNAAALLLLDVADYIPSGHHAVVKAARKGAAGEDAGPLEALLREVEHRTPPVLAITVAVVAETTPLSGFVDGALPPTQISERPRFVRGVLELRNPGRERYLATVQLPAAGSHWLRVSAPGAVEVRADDRLLWRRESVRSVEPPTATIFAGSARQLTFHGVASAPFARLGLDAFEAPAPVDAPVSGWPGQLARLATALRDRNVDDRAAALDALGSEEPTFRIPAVLAGTAPRTARHADLTRQRALAALDGGRPQEARRALSDLLAAADPRSALSAARILRETDAEHAAREALRRAAELAPHACEPARLEFEQDFGRLKLLTGKPGSAPRIPAGCERVPGIAVQLAQFAAETGALEIAAERLRALVETDGADPGTWLTVLERAGRLPEALGSPGAFGDLEGQPAAVERLVDAQRLVERSDADAVRTSLDRAWQLPRGDVETRLRMLSREPKFSEFMAFAPSVIAALAAPLDEKLIEGRASVVLIDHATTLRFGDGTGLQHIRQVMRILSPSAVEGMGEASVPSTGVLLFAATLKPDGRVLEPETIDGKETLSFPDLQVGDAIQLEYLDPLTPDAFLGGGFLESAYFFDLFDVPVHESTYVFLAQPGASPVVQTHGAVPSPEPLSWRGFEGVRFRVGPSPGVVGEPAAASPLDSLKQARAACILERPAGGGAVRCAATREAGLPLTREALLGLGASDAALRRLVATFSAEDEDPEVLVLRIWRYVVEHVIEDDTAWLSVRAVDALAAGQGERAVTALALLWAAGLDAALALTEPVDSGATSVDLANPRVLMHRLVRVRLPGRDLFLDPSMGSVAPGFLLPTVLGQTAWVIGRNPGFERVILPREQPDDERRTIVVELFVDGRAGLTGTWTEVSRGVDAAAYREVLKSQPRSDWNKRLAPFVEEVVPGVDVKDTTVDGMDGTGPVTVRHLLDRPPGDGRDALDLRLVPLEASTRWASLEARQTALIVELNAVVDVTIIVHVAGATLGPLPPPVAARASDSATYSREARATDDGVIIERKLTLRPQVVLREAYAAFRGFAEAVDAGDIVRLPLSKNR